MRFASSGKATLLCGGQFGSEGKGAVAAYMGCHDQFDIATTNAGAQAGHTSIVRGVKRVAFHLPTIAMMERNSESTIYLNAGSIIDPALLRKECEENGVPLSRLIIHPNAAVIVPRHKETEAGSGSTTEKIASTQKGVGAALAEKVMRGGNVAENLESIGFTDLAECVGFLDLNRYLDNGASVAVEVPQGFSLSLNAGSPNFYPHCTSRDCTVAQGLSDASIHPRFLGSTVMVVRTFPIRVGHLPDGKGHSGDVYRDQREISFEELGLPPEYTTVTGRKRRIFTFSREQIVQAVTVNRPEIIALTFLNYLTSPGEADMLVDTIRGVYSEIGLAPPKFLYQWGASNSQIGGSIPQSPEIWRKNE